MNSVRHEYRHAGMTNHVRRDAAQYEFPPVCAPIGAHDDEVGLFFLSPIQQAVTDIPVISNKLMCLSMSAVT